MLVAVLIVWTCLPNVVQLLCNGLPTHSGHTHSTHDYLSFFGTIACDMIKNVCQTCVMQVVWERLDGVDGDTQLCDANFQPYVAPPPSLGHGGLTEIPPEALQGAVGHQLGWCLLPGILVGRLAL